mmetsp:Transcript_15810/g.17540  ORF Transcript_15810/g.17540 Transcript_15810/m.17540 type:complete len:98 (-) Transcript_15810:3-296(-)
MKHYGFPAAAFIGWARICRPGSVLGPQQQFLNEVELDMMTIGDSLLKKDELITRMGLLCLEEKNVEYSPDEKKILKMGKDPKQARILKDKKRAAQMK